MFHYNDRDSNNDDNEDGSDTRVGLSYSLPVHLELGGRQAEGSSGTADAADPERADGSDVDGDRTGGGTGRGASQPFQNFAVFSNEQGPLAAPHLLRILQSLTGGWPRLVDGRLVVPRADGTPLVLASSQQLFAWVHRFAHVHWETKPGYLRKSEFFHFTRQNAEEFRALETLPHVPPLDGNLYHLPELPVPDGQRLGELLDFFCPATEDDRRLVAALFATVFWGGEPGQRPVFLISGPEVDPEPQRAGRGLGKTTLVGTLGELAGRPLHFDDGEGIGAIKKRLLSPAADRLRLAVLDNVKSECFGGAGLESIVTAEVVSGYRLYAAEASRPNTLVWIVTANGAGFTKDMAQRTVQIRLGRPPEFDPAWSDRVKRFVRGNRLGLIADLCGVLNRPASDADATFSRWASWEREVLGRVDPELSSLPLVHARREHLDEEDSRSDQIAELIRQMIVRGGLEPERCRLLIAMDDLADCLTRWLGRRVTVLSVTKTIKQLHIAELAGVVKTRDRNYWEWVGDACPLDEERQVFRAGRAA